MNDFVLLALPAVICKGSYRLNLSIIFSISLFKGFCKDRLGPVCKKFKKFQWFEDTYCIKERNYLNCLESCGICSSTRGWFTDMIRNTNTPE